MTSTSKVPLLDTQYNENIWIESQKYLINNSYLYCELESGVKCTQRQPQNYLYCEGLVFGRMSFRGMNPEIEKLMQELDDKSGDHKTKETAKESTEVSDEEMTNRYSKYISNSSHRKRNMSSHKRHQNQRSDKRFKSSYH
ncbi:unnamed protein product [Oppiella nova]|uniref:Uncharacterized protein n=1 Tax=Oppiella nova TaxID=334625 RepID=A0A7R9Q8V0_9ACAR|nr:unnamed protein product [Oppiella nova]CAG2158883.1 unnamed protein product [Oppiella nova]